MTEESEKLPEYSLKSVWKTKLAQGERKIYSNFVGEGHICQLLTDYMKNVYEATAHTPKMFRHTITDDMLKALADAYILFHHAYKLKDIDEKLVQVARLLDVITTIEGYTKLCLELNLWNKPMGMDAITKCGKLISETSSWAKSLRNKR